MVLLKSRSDLQEDLMQRTPKFQFRDCAVNTKRRILR